MAPASAEVPKGSGLRLEHGSLHPRRIRLHQLRKAVPIPFLRRGPRCCSWCLSPRDQCRRNSESHGGEWCARRGRRSIPIFVAPSQGHDDHTSPDARFGGKHSVAAVPLSLEQRRRPSVSGSGPPRSAPSILAGPRPRRDCNCGARSPLSRPLRSAQGGSFSTATTFVSRASVCTRVSSVRRHHPAPCGSYAGRAGGAHSRLPYRRIKKRRCRVIRLDKPAPFGMLSATSSSGPFPAMGLACD